MSTGPVRPYILFPVGYPVHDCEAPDPRRRPLAEALVVAAPPLPPELIRSIAVAAASNAPHDVSQRGATDDLLFSPVAIGGRTASDESFYLGRIISAEEFDGTGRRSPE